MYYLQSCQNPNLERKNKFAFGNFFGENKKLVKMRNSAQKFLFFSSFPQHEKHSSECGMLFCDNIINVGHKYSTKFIFFAKAYYLDFPRRSSKI